MNSVFQKNTVSHLTKKIFLDEPVDVARYDKVKYPFFDKLTDKQLSFFWRPEEVNCTKDSRDFKELNPHEQHIFTSNLKRQILLDSVQGRSPNIAFLPIVSLPEIETWIATWAFSETIHSRSYTHIIRNVYPDPSVVFDTMLDIQEIVDCAEDISINYDRLIYFNNMMAYDPNANEYMGNEYEHKEALWLALMSVNILEGVRFYVSFACSWAFAELKKMEGNAKIIKLIARDENLHLAATQQLLKLLPQEDTDFAGIRDETKDKCIAMFNAAAQQEKEWAKYLFQDGSMIGLNEALLCQYVDWITNRRKQGAGLPISGGLGSNPLPWTTKWIAGGEVQVAPQQTQISSYTIGKVKQDIQDDSFKDFDL
jgi:ribonucleoside-diphosphate reductase beta chain